MLAAAVIYRNETEQGNVKQNKLRSLNDTEFPLRSATLSSG